MIARVRSHHPSRSPATGHGTPLTEPVSLKAATGIAGSVHHRSEGRRPPPGSSRRLGGHATRAVNPVPTDRRQAARLLKEREEWPQLTSG